MEELAIVPPETIEEVDEVIKTVVEDVLQDGGQENRIAEEAIQEETDVEDQGMMRSLRWTHHPPNQQYLLMV